jgi:hypothetical protein
VTRPWASTVTLGYVPATTPVAANESTWQGSRTTADRLGSVIADFAKLKTMLHTFDERDLTGRQFDNAWSSIRSTLLIFVALYPFAVGGLL